MATKKYLDLTGLNTLAAQIKSQATAAAATALSGLDKAALAAKGAATLGDDGKVPAEQLPSYVDDVIEAASKTAFPATGESGKIYVALDDNKTYRWGGSAYVEISQSLAIGTTEGTAYSGAAGAALAQRVQGLEDSTPASAQTVNDLSGRMTTVEGKVTTLETAITTKVEESDLVAITDAEIAAAFA